MESSAARTSSLSAPKNRNPRKAWQDIWNLAYSIYNSRNSVDMSTANKLMVAITAIPHKGLLINNEQTDDINLVRSEEELQYRAETLYKVYAPIYSLIQNQAKIESDNWDEFLNFLENTKP